MFRRSEIGNDYLDINNDNNSLDIVDNVSITDKIEHIIFQSLKSLGLIFLLLFWGFVPLLLFGIDLSNASDMVRFIFDLLLLLLLIFIYKDTFFRDFRNYFGKDLKHNLKTSFSIWLIGFMIMLFSNLIIANLTEGVLAQNEEAVREMISLSPIYMAFQLVIYAPITEELIFRKSIKNITNHQYIYIMLSGLIFGGLHVLTSINQPFGFLYLIPYSSLGIAFAYLYRKTDNIFSTIVVHSFHNTLALLSYLLLRGI